MNALIVYRNQNLNLMGQIMELNELKIVFDAGALKSATVTPAPMQSGYVLMFNDKVGVQHFMMPQRSKLNEVRIFRSIDAAIANAQKVGFKEVMVKL